MERFFLSLREETESFVRAQSQESLCHLVAWENDPHNNTATGGIVACISFSVIVRKLRDN